MKVEWKIVKFDKERGSIEVNYFDKKLLPEGATYNIDLPIVDNKYPTEEEITKIINGNIPSHIFERKHALTLNLDTAHIEKMVSKEQKLDPNVFTIRATNNVPLQDVQTITPTKLI